MALNLTELSKVSGYGYSSIKSMKLPLISGKMRLSDFWRIIRRRQDAMEDALPAPMPPPRNASTPEDVADVQSLARKLLHGAQLEYPAGVIDESRVKGNPR